MNEVEIPKWFSDMCDELKVDKEKAIKYFHAPRYGDQKKQVNQPKEVK